MRFLKTTGICAALAAVLLCGCAQTSNGSAENTDGQIGKESEKTLAEQLTEGLSAGAYSVDMVLSGDSYDTEMPCKMICKDGNGFVSMTVSGIYTEFYTVDSQTYMLMPDIDCYQITEDQGTFGNALFVIGEGDTLKSESTADGTVTEVYISDGDSGVETYTFNFNEESGMLESFKSVVSDVETDIAINSIDFVGEDIALPDLSDWKEVTDGTDEETQTRLALYYLGITSDVLKNGGYSYDDVLAMSSDEREKLLDELGSEE